MKRLLVLLTLLPTTALSNWNIQVVESPPPQPRDAGWGDPVFFFIFGVVLCLALAALAWKKRDASFRFDVSSRVGLAAAFLGSAIFWPKYLGKSLPFDALGKMSQGQLNNVMLPILIKAIVVGVVVFGIAWYLLPENEEGNDTKS